jgi:hypothetical protein
MIGIIIILRSLWELKNDDDDGGGLSLSCEHDWDGPDLHLHGDCADGLILNWCAYDRWRQRVSSVPISVVVSGAFSPRMWWANQQPNQSGVPSW